MTAVKISESAAGTVDRIAGKRLTRILLPLTVLYMINFIDRNNISFAVIGGMNKDLHIGNAQAGFAGGIFFLAYCILQIPSGILAEKLNIRTMLLILAVLWGVISMATGLVVNIQQLLTMRFLLGLVEGCVWAIILVLLSRWFSDRERATANSIWLTSLPLSFIVMGPLSGVIVQHLGWRWLFIFEGFPAIICAVVVYAMTAARPADAKWLPADEREHLQDAQAGDKERNKVTGYREAIFHPQVLLLSAVYFFWLIGAVGFFMWLPAVLKQVTGSDLTKTGYLSALPYACALIGLLVLGRIADRTGMRKQIVGFDLACFGLLLFGSTLASGIPLLSLVLLIAAGFFLFAMHAPFWAIPMEILPSALVGAAIGMISLIGNIGSFVGPFLVGYAQEATGNFSSGLYLLSASMFIAAFLTIFVKDHQHSPRAAKPLTLFRSRLRP